jgi:L-asparagine transporter-like permease
MFVVPLVGIIVLVTVLLCLTHLRRIKPNQYRSIFLNEMLRNMSLTSLALLCTVLAALLAATGQHMLALAILVIILPTYCVATISTRLTVEQWNWQQAETFET